MRLLLLIPILPFAYAFSEIVGARSPRQSPAEQEIPDAECVPFAECYQHSHCPYGRCIGDHLGTCDCASCVNNLPCNGDQDCGNFKGACNRRGYCDCTAAFDLHNYYEGEFLVNFCNVKSCDPQHTQRDCHGLRCNRGYCHCDE